MILLYLKNDPITPSEKPPDIAWIVWVIFIKLVFVRVQDQFFGRSYDFPPYIVGRTFGV